MMKRDIVGVVLIIVLLVGSFAVGMKVQEVTSVKDLHKFVLRGHIDGIGDVVIRGTMEVEPVMTTVVIPSDADDGEIGLGNVNYNAVWTSSTGGIVDTGIAILLGQFKIAGTYYIDRGFFFFDTSSIPTDAIIDSSKLTFVLQMDLITTDFDITIQNGQPTYPHKPLIASDYDRLLYSGDGGSLNTALLPAVENPFDITLNATGLTWINKGGTTKFCIRSSREIAGTQPTSFERIHLYTFEKGTTYIPTLTVTYHLPIDDKVIILQKNK